MNANLYNVIVSLDFEDKRERCAMARDLFHSFEEARNGNFRSKLDFTEDATSVLAVCDFDTALAVTSTFAAQKGMSRDGPSAPQAVYSRCSERAAFDDDRRTVLTASIGRYTA